jgi:hypothetical protein
MASTTHHHQAGRADTRAISIHASPDHVYDFVSEPQNLPLWAVGFCRSIRRDDATSDRWLVTTPQGEVPVRYSTDRAHRVVDFHLFPESGQPVTAHSRVVPNGDGAEYVFTQLQAPGMPDAVFDAQVTALIEELEVLQRIMAARAACPA